MTYTPINWQNGDIITAEKMNKMDNGWSSQIKTVANETFTAENGESYYQSELVYNKIIDAPVITVVFDNEEYTCELTIVNGTNFYGAEFSGDTPDFGVYPFTLISPPGYPNVVLTETDGSHTIVVKYPSIETSSDFNEAVVIGSPLKKINPYECTWQEVHDLIEAGNIAYYVKTPDSLTVVFYIVTKVGKASNDYFMKAIYIGDEGIAVDTLTVSSADSVFD